MFNVNQKNPNDINDVVLVIINFEHISHLFLVLLTLTSKCWLGSICLKELVSRKMTM